MDSTQKSALLLMKSAVTGENYALPDDTDMEQLYELLKRHNISGLGYYGAAQCGVSKSEPVMDKMFRDYRVSVIINERQMAAVRRVFDAFEENGISYMPVKGCIMKKLYPHPELRNMGDADILIHMEQYDRIREIMQSLGFQEGEEADHALVWLSPALMVELHRKLIPSNEEYCDYYGNGWCKAAYSENGHYYMTTEDAYLYLFVHFVKHFCGAGIGLRHLLDLWVYRRNYPDMDLQYLEKELTRLRLREFHGNLMNLIGAIFEDGELDAVTDPLLQYILHNGTWGNMENMLLSEGVKNAGNAHSAKEGRSHWLVEVLFPPRRKLLNRYTVLKKAPVLLPAVWVFRWFDVLLFRRDRIQSRVNDYHTLNEKNITDHQRMMNRFGFHFE